MVNIDKAKKDIQVFYRKVFNVMIEYREKHHGELSGDYPLFDFYSKIWDNEDDFNFWKKYKFEREDVSDERVDKETNLNEFKQSEKFKRLFGLWLPTPSFQKLNYYEREQLENDNYFNGKVQVMSGTTYFLLNYVKLLDENSGEFFRPNFYRKSDQITLMWETLFYIEISEYENRQGMLWSKPRSAQATTLQNVFILNLSLDLREGFTALGTIDTPDKAIETGSKIMTLYETLPIWRRSWKPAKENIRDLFSMKQVSGKGSELNLDFWDNKTNTARLGSSKVVLRGAKPKLLESQRGAVLFNDEWGKYEYSLTKVKEVAGACLMNQTRRIIGLHIAMGTSDANMAQNLTEFRRMHQYAKSYNFFSFFSGSHHYGVMDAHGFPKEDEMVAHIMRERALKEESGDPKLVLEHKIINPLELKDCMLLKDNDFLEIKGIQDRISLIEKSIILGDGVVKPIKGHFEVDRKNYFNPVFVPSEPFCWTIYEMPTRKHLSKHSPVDRDYCGGSDNVDAYMNDKMIDSKKISEQAMVICNVSSEKIVAEYLYRHQIPSVDYEQKLLGAIFYNTQYMIEKNKTGELNWLLFDHYVLEEGILPTRGGTGLNYGFFKKFIAQTPTKLLGRNESIPFGIDTSSKKKQMYIDSLVPFVNRNYMKQDSTTFLNIMLDWDIDNRIATPDLGMAAMMMTLHLDDVKSNIIRKGNKGSDLLKKANAALSEIYG